MTDTPPLIPRHRPRLSRLSFPRHPLTNLTSLWRKFPRGKAAAFGTVAPAQAGVHAAPPGRGLGGGIRLLCQKISPLLRWASRNILKKLLPPLNPRHVFLVLLRFWYEYRQLWRTQIVRDLIDRLIFLFAFGLGMGHLLSASHGGNYLAFIVPGMAASTGLLVMSVSMTFGVYERLQTTRLWPAWLATPLRLPEILLAELLYAALRSLPSTLILLAVAYFMDALPSPLGALASLPFLLLANLALGAVALAFTSHIHRTLHFAYIQTLWTGPLFLFSGVFFDLHQAPEAYQWVSEFSPLRHVIDIVRPLMLGTGFDPLAAALDTLLLLTLFLAAYRYALWRFAKRLLD